MENRYKIAVDLIAEFEGFEPKPYKCPAGVWTIGYGQTQGVTAKSKPVTEKQARERLYYDVTKVFAPQLDGLLEVKLTDEQYAALLSFTYNLGAGALRKSTLLRMVNQRRWDSAKLQFYRWVFAGGRKLNGLIRRRKREAELFARTALV